MLLTPSCVSLMGNGQQGLVGAILSLPEPEQPLGTGSLTPFPSRSSRSAAVPMQLSLPLPAQNAA